MWHLNHREPDKRGVWYLMCFFVTCNFLLFFFSLKNISTICCKWWFPKLKFCYKVVPKAALNPNPQLLPMISNWRDTLLCSPPPLDWTQRCWGQLSLVFICHGFPFLWDSHLHLSLKYMKTSQNVTISCPVCPELLNSWRSVETESEDWCVGKQLNFLQESIQCHCLLFIRMKISPLCLLKKVVRKIALSLFLKLSEYVAEREKFLLPSFLSLPFFFPKANQNKPY